MDLRVLCGQTLDESPSNTTPDTIESPEIPRCPHAVTSIVRLESSELLFTRLLFSILVVVALVLVVLTIRSVSLQGQVISAFLCLALSSIPDLVHMYWYQ